MFFKKSFCIAIAIFPLSIAPSAMKRDASTSSFDLVAVDAQGNEITPSQLAGKPASPRAATVTPHSEADYVRVTPVQDGAAAQPALSLDLSRVPHDQTPAPGTPQNSLAISQITTEPPLTPKSIHSQAPETHSLPAPVSMHVAVAALHLSMPQQLPVDPLPIITPSATPRPNTPNSLAGSAARIAALAIGSPAAAVQSSTPSLAQAPIAPILATPPLTEQQRAAFQIPLASLRNGTVPMPQAAQRPMQVAQHPPMVRRTSGHAIDIAPESPAKNRM